MAKKTTAAERRAYVQEQRVKPQGYGANAVFPRDMSFLDRLGNIIRPNKRDWEASLKSRESDTYEDTPYAGRPVNNRKYQDTRKAYRLEKEGKLVEASKAYRTAGDDIDATRVMQEYMKRRGSSRERARGLYSVIAIAGLFGGLFFLSNNVTGDAIRDITTSNSSLIGAFLFIVGIAGALLYFKTKKKTFFLE